jgi:hypothetical protein
MLAFGKIMDNFLLTRQNLEELTALEVAVFILSVYCSF